MRKAYADILAKATQLLGKPVVLHWTDSKGELCGVSGTLKRISPAEYDDILRKSYPKRLELDNYYACVDIGRVTHIELGEEGTDV